MSIFLAIAVVLICLVVGACAVLLFVIEMKSRRELRAQGIIPLGWGMRMYPMTPIPPDKDASS